MGIPSYEILEKLFSEIYKGPCASFSLFSQSNSWEPTAYKLTTLMRNSLRKSKHFRWSNFETLRSEKIFSFPSQKLIKLEVVC